MKLTPEQKTARAAERKAQRAADKDNRRIEIERTQKPVKSIVITVEWKKSVTWGHNPNAEAAVEYHDGSSERCNGFKCSGCGYDKESTVIADIFNTFLKYKLWNLSEEAIKGGNGSGDSGPAPYGVRNYTTTHRNFAGGIGTDCYERISEYIGGKFERIASGKSFDVFKYTDIRVIYKHEQYVKAHPQN